MSAIDYCICIEELARVDPGVALSVAAHNGLCAAHIAMFGTDAQKQQLPRAAGARREARRLGADRVDRRAATRPACGRPPSAHGDGWVLERLEDVHHARPRRRRDGRDGGHRSQQRGTQGHLGVHRRAAARRACRAGKKEDKLGMRASDTSEVLFENCRVPARPAARRAKGSGFVNTMQVLDAGRIGIAALAVGLAQGAYEAALRYAQERQAFGTADRRASRRFSGSWPTTATRIEAARLLTYRAAYLKDRGAPDDARVGDGEAVRERDRRAGGRRLRADPRRLRLREGLPGREISSATSS